MAEQLMLDGMPDPEFDRGKFTDAQLARAQQNIDECKHLIARFPDLLSFAYALICQRVAQAGHAGTRWLGEQVRTWLNDAHDGVGFTNGIIAVLVRLIVDEHPWVEGFVTMKWCAIDAVMAGDVS